MSSASRRRLIRDFRRIKEDPPKGVIAAPDDNDVFSWSAVINGPLDTPWDGGVFRLSLQFTDEYPSKPPKVKFLTKLFHPNVYSDGSICLDILQNQWSPIYDVSGILTSIQSLLTDPNPNSPANAEAARLFVDDPKQYEKRVREYVEKSWSDSSDADGNKSTASSSSS